MMAMRFARQVPNHHGGLFTPDPKGPAQGSTQDETGNKAANTLEQAMFNVHKCPKGKYYWLHETNLYRNPTFLFLMWKIFFFIWLAVATFIMILAAWGDDLFEALRNIGLPLFYVLIFVLVLITFSYWVYALIMGGKYSVLFEMDEKGVTHTQLPKQFEKAQNLAALATLTGVAAKNSGTVGAGLLVANGQSMRTDFKRLRAIKASRRKSTIKLRSSDLMHNQIYTAPEDFDFVLDFIQARSSQARFHKPDPSQ
ncbi:MAG: hypothetical protein GX215_00750 [Clostridiales Family XIII bacterium]|nr:hypothetical protein [Clostridiales Family XIII bacterium]